MKTEERSGAEERAILTGMLTNRQVCARLAQGWTSDGLFRSKHANLLGGWAVDHFNKYGDAPGPKIQLNLEHYAKQTQDKDTLALVESLVSGLSVDWQGSTQNPDYILDVAQKYTAGVTVERAIAEAQREVGRGEVDEAISRLSRLSPPIVSSKQWIDPFRDPEAVRKAWEQANDPLIVFPGDLGLLYKNTFRRDAFVSFRAIAKAGKSFNLLELMYRGLLQKRRVAYFCVGDMSESQVLQRIGQRVAKRPLYAGNYEIPYGWDESDPEVLFPLTRTRCWTEDMTWEESVAAGTAFMEKVGAQTDETLCRLSVHNSSGLNAISLNAQLVQWEIQGWVPDIVLIDYADLLGMIPGIKERWQSVEETWRQLRTISQQFHCCVATAAQSNADGYDAEVLDMGNFSGSRTQNDNVTAMYSITMNDRESDLGIQRIKKIANRDNSDNRMVATLGNRAVACPVMFSKFCVKPVQDDSKGKGKRNKP